MTRRRHPALAGAVAAAVLVLCGPAAPAPAALLTPPDAAELAQTLADATTEQGVCYGWAFGVSDASGEQDGPDVGSNGGPGVPVQTVPGCRRFVELQGSVTFTSESSESEDSSFWSIRSNLARAPTTDDLDDLGYGSGGLQGDDNDTVLFNAVSALPQLVADKGEAEPVPFEQSTEPRSVQGAPTDSPGSDFLRENGIVLALCALLLIGGLVWLTIGILAARRKRRRKRSGGGPAGRAAPANPASGPPRPAAGPAGDH